MWCSIGDEGWPFGVALRGEASNRPLLRWLKTVVVSDVGKGAHEVSGRNQGDVASQPVKCRNVLDGIRTGALERSLG